MTAGYTPESSREKEHDLPDLARFDRFVEGHLGLWSSRKFVTVKHPELVFRVFRDTQGESAADLGLLVVGDERPLAREDAVTTSGPEEMFIVDGAPVVTTLRVGGRWQIRHQSARKLDPHQLDDSTFFWQEWAPQTLKRALPLWQPDARELLGMLDGAISRIDMLER